MRRESKPAVVSITDVGAGSEQEFTHRRRRYSVMMAIRGVCVILAAVAYAWSPWLSLALIVGGAVIPWCAVLLANDGPPKRTPPNRERLRARREDALGPGEAERAQRDGTIIDE